MGRLWEWLAGNGSQPTVQRRALLPHERWPEILHWQKGDEFYVFETDDRCYVGLVLIAVTEDGYAYCQDDSFKVRIHLRYLVGHNQSADTRRVSDEMATSNEYMELINQFNVSLDELKQRDNRNGETNVNRT